MQELYKALADDNSADVEEVIRLSLAQQPFQQICLRLLHCIDDTSLLDFLSNILGSSASQNQLQRLVFTADREPAVTAASAAKQLEQCLMLIMFGCVRWQDLDDFAAHVAWAFHFQQVQKSWEVPENAEARTP